MIFYMGSKTFQDEFLVNENDDDILATQYVIVSQRIQKGKKSANEFPNMIIGNSIFYPSSETLIATSEYAMHEKYLKQLNANRTFFARIIMDVLQDNINVVFLCTEKELRLKYFLYMEEFVMNTFGYPIYDYHLYTLEAVDLIPYNKKKILKKCKNMREDDMDQGLQSMLKDKVIKTEKEEDHVRRMLKRNYSKKALKRYVKELGYYEDGMTTSDMIDTIITFL